MDNLRFIRETMERSESFTHVSGIGGVLMGVIALLAGAVSWLVSGTLGWLPVWIGAAPLAVVVALWAMARKSRAEGGSLLTVPGRKFLWSLAPALVAGAALSFALVQGGAVDLLPGVWLLLYGVGVVTGGSHSVRPVPATGVAFMMAGFAALVSPAVWGGAYMVAGFGGLHIVSGYIIWRKHGG